MNCVDSMSEWLIQRDGTNLVSYGKDCWQIEVNMAEMAAKRFGFEIWFCVVEMMSVMQGFYYGI